MNKPKPLVLVDGSSYLYRAFHAMPNLNNSRGEPTGAVYGVTNMLRKLLNDYEPEHIAVVFDAPGKTFRDELFEQYKAHRPSMPDELRSQIEALHAIVEAMGLPLLMISGVEADDVIGTLAAQATGNGMHTLISTGDKDMAQLVDEHVSLIDTMKDAHYDRQAVIDKFGVPPERIVEYLALIGDTSDNIPGVPKVGPKTAVKWLQEYGSLDALVQHAADIGGKVGENLRASLGFLPLSRQLATIKCDVSLPLQAPQLKRQPPDTARLRELYQRMEFKSWLADLGGANAQPAAPNVTNSDHGYVTLTDMAELDTWIARLQRAPLFAFDTETTDLDVMNAEIVGVSFTDVAGEGVYVPLKHEYPGAPQQLDRAAVPIKLLDVRQRPHCTSFRFFRIKVY